MLAGDAYRESGQLVASGSPEPAIDVDGLPHERGTAGPGRLSRTARSQDDLAEEETPKGVGHFSPWVAVSLVSWTSLFAKEVVDEGGDEAGQVRRLWREAAVGT